MSFETNLDFVDFDGLEKYHDFLNANVGEPEKRFLEIIHVPLDGLYQSIHAIHLGGLLSVIDSKAQRVAHNHGIVARNSVSGEIGGKVSWGGEDGVQISGYASGSASDDNGNKAEVTVEVNSDGSGSASASVSHEEDIDS